MTIQQSTREQMQPAAIWAERPWLVDGLLAAGVAVFGSVVALLGNRDGGGDPANGASYVLVSLAALAILLRRRQPVVALLVVVVSRIALSASVSHDPALAPAAVVALYTVARAGDRRRNTIIAVVAAIIMSIGVAIFDNEPFLPELLGELALMLLPIAVADATRSRADRVRAMIDTEADQRVAAERLRIARDLHDVVAHGLSTIAVQSGVAAHLLDRDPNQAKVALETINETGKSALEELRMMVGVLRSTDDAPLRPTPTDPNDLSELIESAANAGVEVTVSRTGQFPAGAGDSCVVALHRIVQEALTNVARHAGPAPASLVVCHNDDHVTVTITNEQGTKPNTTLASTGVGIIGMTERAEAVGGTLTADPLDSGGFEVVATIPYGQRNGSGAIS